METRNKESGNFYTVATPIGNLSDITQHAIEILSSVDAIACEDKRVSAILLDKLNIKKPLLVYQKHNEQEASSQIIKMLNLGKNVALVSDAGTPCISDPGRIIVNKLADKNIKTTCITGACAITTLLASVPKDDEEFSFCGFLPRTKNEQEKIFEKFKNIDLVFYESPKRLIETLENIIEFRGNSQKIAVGRELTKKFEEIMCDTAENILNYYKQNTLKGEIAAVLYKSANKTIIQYDAEVKKLLKENFSAKDIATIISTLYETNKKEIYNLAVKFKN